MDEEVQEFAALMQRLAGGSQEAARELYDRYGPHIRRVVRRRLIPALRPKFDSIDFEQDVWKSFFAQHGPHCVFEGPEHLVSFLTTMAYRKVADAFRERVFAQKHCVHREKPLNNATLKLVSEKASPLPTPSQQAMGREEWEQLLKGQGARNRRILELFRLGNSREQIAQELGLSERTVSRLLQKLAARLVP